MLHLMRKHARNWMMKVLLGIIIFVFVLYFGSMGGRHRAEAIVTIDGKIISQAEFERQYRDLVDVYRQRFGGFLTDEMIRSLNLKGQVLDKMVYQALLMKKAKEMGIKVTSEELRASITSIPAFQRNGMFDETLYQRMLHYNRMKPEEFEELQREHLIALKLENLILDGVHVSDQEVYDYFQAKNAQINLITCHLSYQDFMKDINVGRADLERYLKEHGEEFRVPAQIKLRYLFFSARSYADQVTVSPEEIAEYRRTLSGKSSPGTLSDDKIIQEIKKIKGMRRAYEEAKKAHDEIYQYENFDAYAEKHHLPVKATDYFTEQHPPEELNQVKDLAKIAFSLQRNEISRVLATDDGYVILRLVDRKESHIPTLSAVEDEVKKRYMVEEAKKRALREAETIVARLHKGEKLEHIARERRLPVRETGLFPISSPPSSLGKSEQLFPIINLLNPQRRVAERPITVEDGYLVVELKDWVTPRPEAFAEKKEVTKAALLQAKKAEVLRFWIDALKGEMLKDGRLKYHKDVKEL